MIERVVKLKQAYSVKGFCEAFDIQRTQLFEEMKAGRLASRRVGRRTLIRAAGAKAWLDSLPLARASTKG